MEGRRKERLFRFEAMWVGEKGCEDIIEDTWRTGTINHGVQNFMSFIYECSEKLTAWNRVSFGNVHKQLERAKQKMKHQ